jgi:3-phosphoshikimate 1-carboxyvinyltransferase
MDRFVELSWDRRRVMTTHRSMPIRPGNRIEGEISVPGDKSISHRALLVGAMGRGEMPIAGLSPADDVASSMDAARAVGVQILKSDSNVERWPPSTEALDFHVLLISNGIDSWTSPKGPVNVGNSGTTIRVLAGMIAGSFVGATLTGDDSIRRRPMARVVQPLRAMGAQIEGAAGGDRAPLSIQGAPLVGVDHTLEIASAQVKTALLLAGLRASGRTSIQEPTPSRDHTERLLRYMDVPIDVSGNRLIVKSTNIQNAPVQIPGDISSAAFLLVAAAILPGSDLTVPNVGLNPTRTGIAEILRAYGAEVEVRDVVETCGEPAGSVRVRAGDRRPLEVSGDLVVRSLDELPLVGVLGALAEGTTVVRDAAELRVKESDRVETVVRALSTMGAEAEGTPDGFIVHGTGRLTGSEVDSAGDHRIAMAFAIAALAADGPSVVSGWDAVGVSYPGFEQVLDRLVVR